MDGFNLQVMSSQQSKNDIIYLINILERLIWHLCVGYEMAEGLRQAGN